VLLQTYANKKAGSLSRRRRDLEEADRALLEFEGYEPDKEEIPYEWQRATGFQWETDPWEPEARAECIYAYFEVLLFHTFRKNVELCGLLPLVHWEIIRCGYIPYREKHTLITDVVRAGHPFIVYKGKLDGWPTSKTPRWKTVQCSEYEEEGSSYPHITLVTLQSVNGGEKLLFGELAPLVQAICNRMGQEEFNDEIVRSTHAFFFLVNID